MTYPDGEKLHYAYDNGGLLKAAWGEKSGNRYDYIKTLLYDEFGQRTYIVYGNGTKSTYAYDELTRSLATLHTVLKDGREVQKLSYEYDLMGNIGETWNNITVPTNTALPAGPVRQTYEYDDLYQVVNATGWYSFGPGKENNYHNEFFYDTIGNFVKKNQVHKIIQPSMTETLPKETNHVLNYHYKTQGSTKPHAVTETDDKLYTYDPAGNMTGWTHKQNGTKRVITWNEENRVKQIDDNGKSTYFLYDDDGERVVKRGQHGETIYVNRFFSIRNGELGTKSVYAGETRVVSKLVKTPPTNTANTTTTTTTTTITTGVDTTTIPGEQGLEHGKGKKLGIIKRLPDGYQGGINPPVEKDQFFYHGDHLGSSNMITDAYGAVYQHLEYFPYGETWIEEGGSYGGNTPGYKFTGKELDPETGLYYYGARYYDPVLSRWISADPILETYLGGMQMGGVFNAKNLAPYGYAYNNPLSFIDPDGTKGEFPTSTVGEINDMGLGWNSAQRFYSSFRPADVVYGKDCIKLHNAIIQDVLYKNPNVKVGTQIVGPNSTHQALQKAQKASALTTFGFVDKYGKDVKSNATAYALKKSVGEFVKSDYEGEGVKVYGLSVLDGFHSLTLTYGKNKKGQLEFNLYDQGPVTGWFSGHSTFETPQQLDKALNKYVRSRQDVRTKKEGGFEYRANMQIYQIYSDKDKEK